MIDNQVLIDVLKSRGITLVSAINEIRAGTAKPGRAHIRSFRRQVYILEGDVALIPESLQISHEGTPYWIYLSTDSTNCFVCKQNGHTAKNCPVNYPNLSSSDQNSPISPMETQNNAKVDSSAITSNDQAKALKRPPPASTTSEDSIIEVPIDSGDKTAPNPPTINLSSTTKDKNFKKPSNSKKQ